MGRNIGMNGGRGGGGGKTTTTAHKKAFQNTIALRLKKLEQIKLFNTQVEVGQWKLQKKQ